MIRWLFLLIIILGLTACADDKVYCEQDEDCGYSCTYGCVAGKWYNNQQETRLCDSAESCECVDSECVVQGE